MPSSLSSSPAARRASRNECHSAAFRKTQIERTQDARVAVPTEPLARRSQAGRREQPAQRQTAQGVERAFAAPLLNEADAHHDEDDAQQHQGLLDVAQCHVQRAARHQQQEHRFEGHLAHQPQHAAGAGHRQLVRAVLQEPLLCLVLAQPLGQDRRGSAAVIPILG